MKENLFTILGTQLIMRPIFNLLVVFLAIFG